GLTTTARSWLTPAFAVHMSAFADRIARQFPEAVTGSERPESINVQPAPSLPVSRGWLVIEAALMPLPFGMNCIVNRVGEKGPSPAPARICAPRGCGLFVFQTSARS